ncbi:membrane protein insertase YidC [Candidatus Curtissbacteria bacterium]|nr:membrane protein insertase YidC [Candidatus Curtissbacteria bacterium]
MNPFEVFLTTPILNLLVIYYKILETISIPGALGFAIILLTVTVRLLLWPLTTAQLKSAQKMAALKPHLDQIKTTHGHDKIRHQQEVTKLYKEHGVNPLAGCLPILLQIPVFIALYNVLLKIVELKGDFLSDINSKLYTFIPHLAKIPDTSFANFNLSAKPSDWQQAGFLLLLTPLLTGFFQFIQSKMMMPLSPQKINALSVQKDKSNLEDTMGQMQSQMVFLMPAMIAFFSYGFPIGLSLYWNTFTIIGIIQQYVISGAGALNKYLPKKFQK